MRTLLWLRWHEALDEVSYWLRLIDYDVQDRSRGNQAYAVYLLVFFLWWTVGVVAIVSSSAMSIGQRIDPTLAARAQGVVPIAIIVAQVALWCMALRSSPFQLTTPDTAYLSNAARLRLPLILLNFVAAVALPTLIGSVIGYFFTLLFGHRHQEFQLIESALQTAAVLGLATVATFSIAWLLGLARMSFDRLRHIKWLWLVPLVLLPTLLIRLSPTIALWQLYPSALFAPLDYAPAWLPRLVLAAVGFVGLVVLSRKIDMTAVREESAIYAQLQAIGTLRLVAPSAYERAQRDIRSARTKALLRLPAGGRVTTLVARSALAFVRRPVLLLQIISSAALVITGVGIALSQPSPLVLVAWLYGAMLLPTQGLTYAFRADTEDDYLRQFLRINPLELLAGEGFFATALTILLSTAIAATQLAARSNLALGIALIVCLSVMLTACHGASLVPLTDYHVRPARGVVVLAAFGVSLGAGLLLGNISAVLAASVLCVLILSQLIASSDG